jgi:hypothetical protein
MIANKHTFPIVAKCLLKIGQVSVLMSPRDGTHGLDLSSLSILGGEFDREESGHVFWLKGS